MSDTQTEHINETLQDTAAKWYARINSDAPTDVDIEAHMEWLLADPAHVLAYEKAAEAVQSVHAYEQQVRAAFSDAFSLPKAKAKKQLRLWGGWRWPQFAAAATAAAAALMFVAVSNYSLTGDLEPSYYASNASEVDQIVLSDGSRVSLFADTALTFKETDTARTVELAYGRAFFDVVSDKSKPFYVNTGARQVKVVGTRFEVVRADGFDQVAVNEGLVAVAPKVAGQSIAAPILIEPGTIAEYRDNSAEPTLRQAPKETIGAWREGVLVFKDETVAVVLERIRNLFPTANIQADSKALEKLTFTGTLAISDAAAMVRQLAEFLSLKVTISGDTINLSK